MKKLTFATNERLGAFRIMNATNGGPFHKRHANDQYRSNFQAYKEAKIPYARNHDASFCYAYGGEHFLTRTGLPRPRAYLTNGTMSEASAVKIGSIRFAGKRTSRARPT